MEAFVLPFQMDNLLSGVHDANLKLSLAFGIGLHHAGLHHQDRKMVEELFVNQKIQVGCHPSVECVIEHLCKWV